VWSESLFWDKACFSASSWELPESSSEEEDDDDDDDDEDDAFRSM
jgi:hypothetical protein